MAGTTKPNVVKTKGPVVAQGGWDHKAECGENQRAGCGTGWRRVAGTTRPDVVRAKSLGVAWVVHSGYKPSGKGQ